MSNPPDRPWSEEEKNILLTEILKKDGIPSDHLFKLIKDNNILPKWTEIPLPPGRSLSSCQMAFNQMHHSHIPDQRSLQSFQLETSASSSHMSPYQQSSSIPKKRHIQPLEPLSRSTPSTPRAIQPRPPTSGGGKFNGSSSTDSGAHVAQISPGLDMPVAEPPRKRGRPSKEETQRRMREALARGEEYPPPKRKPGPKPKNRQPGSSPRTTGGGVGAGGHGNQLSTATSRLQTAIEMDAPPGSGTLHGEPSSATSDRRRQEHIDRSTAEQQQHRQPTEPHNIRSDSTLASSPRTRLGGSVYPQTDHSVGGARVMGQDESGGGGGRPLSTPRTILASQMSAPPAPSSYAPSFRGINEMTGAPGAPNTSTGPGIGSGSPHGMGRSPTVTMAGETIPGGGIQKYQLAPGPGSGGGIDGGGGGGPGAKQS